MPLSFANTYETSKINVPVRRANMARTQSLISGGRVFRGRRRILAETLAAYIADRNGIARPAPAPHWFRLEDPGRGVSENDLRDMMAFMTVLPLADILVAEKQFVNLSRQARLDERYGTKLLTLIHELT